MKKITFLMTSILFFLTACHFGEAEFGTNLQQTQFNPNGTVFSYSDAHNNVTNNFDRPQLNIMMSWLVFDPNSDLSHRSGHDLEDMRHEMELRDNLLLTIKDQATVFSGAVFEEEIFINKDEPRTFLPQEIGIQVHFGQESLDLGALFGEKVYYGSIRKIHLRIDRAQFTNDSKSGVSGHLSIDFSRSDTDPAAARIGRIEGDFIAPWVSEIHAEHNLQVLEVNETLQFQLQHNWSTSQKEEED